VVALTETDPAMFIVPDSSTALAGIVNPRNARTAVVAPTAHRVIVSSPD
jgi:hypothetical protein